MPLVWNETFEIFDIGTVDGILPLRIPDALNSETPPSDDTRRTPEMTCSSDYLLIVIPEAT